MKITSFLIRRTWAQDNQTDYQCALQNQRSWTNQIHSGIGKMIVKIQTPKFLLHFDPVASVSKFDSRVDNTHLWQIFLSSVILSALIFSIIVWIANVHVFDEGAYFPNKCCHENNKYFVKNMNILDTNYHWKMWVHCIITRKENIAISKYTF